MQGGPTTAVFFLCFWAIMFGLFGHLDNDPFTPRLLIEVVNIQENHSGTISAPMAGAFIRDHANIKGKMKYAAAKDYLRAARKVADKAATYPSGSDAKKAFLDRPLKSQQEKKKYEIFHFS